LSFLKRVGAMLLGLEKGHPRRGEQRGGRRGEVVPPRGARGRVVEAAPARRRGRASQPLRYLEELSEYLPEKEQAAFLRSDARLKIEYIKSRLQGKGGIRKRIEAGYGPSGTSKAGRSETLDIEKVAETIGFMRDLAAHHPDKTLGNMLQSKLNRILHKIRG
jgi:hypothetical protein